MSGPTTQDEAQLRERLRALRVDPPPGDFEATLHRKLAQAGPPEEPGLWERLRTRVRPGPWLWPALGVAAGVVLVLSGALLRRGATGPAREPPKLATRDVLPPPEDEATTLVPASKVAMIRMNLTAEVATDNAEIRVSLPDGLVFWSHGEALAQRSFSWNQALAAGDNDIPIAIRGQRPGRYRVTVTARAGSTRVEDEVVLEVTKG